MEEFEKRLTAVHTRGLENVESPEMDGESQREGGASEKTVTHTPLPSRGRARTKKGRHLALDAMGERKFDELNHSPPSCRSSKALRFHP